MGTNSVLRLMMGMSPGTRPYRELWSHGPLASVKQLLPPVNQIWWKFAPCLCNSFRVSQPIVAHDDVNVLSHLHNLCLLLQVGCLVRFGQLDLTSGTHCGYRR